MKTYKVKATFIFLDGTQVHIVETWKATSVEECHNRLWRNRSEPNIVALIAVIHEETLQITKGV